MSNTGAIGAQSMHTTQHGAELLKILCQNRFIAGSLVVGTTGLGMVIGITLMQKIQRMVEDHLNPSSEVQSSYLYKGSFIAVSLLPVVGLNVMLAKSTFFPIPFSGRTSALIAISTLAFAAGCTKGVTWLVVNYLNDF